jgi:DNA-nicking Smr family endonuclease
MPPSKSDPSRPLQRKRVLSEEERALWEGVARQTKPLRKRTRLAKGHAKAQAIPPALEAPAVRSPAAPPRPIAPAPVPKSTKPAIPPLAPLGRRERSRLLRGKSGIEARLDLHGMTQIDAHHALYAFLQRAHGDGLTFVLVITGKGKVSGGEFERGVLRRQVPHWLSQPEFRAMVVGFEEAHGGHGGAGALYVRIRRSRG